jgi:hypothetical protein
MPGLGSIHARHEQLVVAGVAVANRRGDGKLKRSRIEGPASGAAAHSAAATLARVTSDLLGPIGGTAREEAHEFLRHLSLEGEVVLGATTALSLAAPGPSVSVGEAFLLRPLERFLLDQDALTLVALPRPAEANDHG